LKCKPFAIIKKDLGLSATAVLKLFLAVYMFWVFLLAQSGFLCYNQNWKYKNKTGFLG